MLNIGINKTDIIRPQMTLIVALKSKHGAVLAGDKRNLNPQTLSKDDTATKVFRLNDKAAIGGSGNRFDCKEIIDAMLAEPGIKNLNLEQVKDLLLKKTREKQTEWLDASPMNAAMVQAGVTPPPQFGFILIGLSDSNISKMYELSSNDINPKIIDDNHCQLGWVDVSKYLFLTMYREAMTLEEMSNLAKMAIEGTNLVSVAVSKDMDIIKIEPRH